MIVPIQIDLRVGLKKQSCTFIAHVSLEAMPDVGHRLVIEHDRRQIGTTVSEICHFISETKNSYLLITHPIILSEYDEMLKILDWFKALYKVENIYASDADPELYYKFYRNLIHVLNLTNDPNPIVKYDPTSIKIFAEASRAVWAAEILKDNIPHEESFLISRLNGAIKTLHAMVLERKKLEPDGANMLSLIKIWERTINQDSRIGWNASVQDCLSKAKEIFHNLPSVQSHQSLLHLV